MTLFYYPNLLKIAQDERQTAAIEKFEQIVLPYIKTWYIQEKPSQSLIIDTEDWLELITLVPLIYSEEVLKSHPYIIYQIDRESVLLEPSPRALSPSGFPNRYKWSALL